jgi:hypothetical protein
MTLEDITRHEPAAIAAQNIRGEKKDYGLAVGAMANFYEGVGLRNDPVINAALDEAVKGGDAGITNTSLIEAMKFYGNLYMKAVLDTDVSELTNYFGEGLNLSDDVKNKFKEYKSESYEELMKKAEAAKDDEKKKLENIIKRIAILQQRKINKAEFELKESFTEGRIESLYTEPEEELAEAA